MLLLLPFIRPKDQKSLSFRAYRSGRLFYERVCVCVFLCVFVCHRACTLHLQLQFVFRFAIEKMMVEGKGECKWSCTDKWFNYEEIIQSYKIASRISFRKWSGKAARKMKAGRALQQLGCELKCWRMHRLCICARSRLVGGTERKTVIRNDL